MLRVLARSVCALISQEMGPRHCLFASEYLQAYAQILSSIQSNPNFQIGIQEFVLSELDKAAI